MVVKSPVRPEPLYLLKALVKGWRLIPGDWKVLLKSYQPFIQQRYNLLQPIGQTIQNRQPSLINLICRHSRIGPPRQARMS